MLRIVVNPNSGPALSPNPAPALRDGLPGAEVIELDGERAPDDVLREAAEGADSLGVSGGDGTVGCAAQIALDAGIPLLVVPGGTLNHFAGDVGVASVDDAVTAAQAGTTIHVDTAEIDGRLFLNNASIGAYPHVVDVRERWEHRIGKWPALLVALLVVLRRGSPCELELDGRRRRVWLAFFGNCTYDQTGLIASGRTRLDDGLLDIRLVHADRRFARLRLLACVLTGRVDRCSVYEARTAARVTVRVLGDDAATVRLAADGEVFDGSGVFEVRKRPSALAVFVPAAPAA